MKKIITRTIPENITWQAENMSPLLQRIYKARGIAELIKEA